MILQKANEIENILYFQSFQMIFFFLNNHLSLTKKRKQNKSELQM
jgi:hypothetical protein